MDPLRSGGGNTVKLLIHNHSVFFTRRGPLRFLTGSPPTIDNIMCCRKLSEFHANIDIETKQLDNILRDLRNYYHTVKTKRQLGLEIPAGFRRELAHKKEFTLHSPLRKSSLLPADNLEVLSDSSEILDNTDSCEVPSIPEIHSGLELALSPTTPITAQSSLPNHTPLTRSVDKISSSLPKTMLMTDDYLRACVGFRRVDTLKKQY